MFSSPYQLRYDFCALIIFIVIVLIFFRKKDIYRMQNKIFLVMAMSEIFSCVGDIWATIMSANQHIFPRPLGSFFHILYLVSHISICASLYLYILSVCGLVHTHLDRKYILSNLPWALMVLTVLTNPFHSLMFYYDQNGIYTRGPLMYMMYATATYYLPLSIYYIAKYRKVLPGEKFGALLLFIVASFGSTLFQMFNRYILIELFTQSVCGLWIFFTIENDEEIINPLTKIYNRKAFVSMVNNPLQQQKEFRIILIKLTNLNYYASILGYSFMQRVIKDVAQWLAKTVGYINAYDLDNGSFAVTIISDKPGFSSSDIEDKLCEKFLNNWNYQDAEVDFNTQLCIINLPRDVKSIEELMTVADTTNYKTGSKVTIVQNDLLDQVKRQAAVENAIVNAVRDKTFQVYFQPIWDAKDNKIHSAEALVRLTDKELGVIGPDEFIPIAEKNGKIKDIGEFVFEETCRFYVENHLKELGIDFIEVNMSTAQLVNKDLATKLNTILNKYNLDSHTINLEITESSAINAPDAFQKTLKELQGLDFSFSLDDYGTGYSNISYIFNMDFAIIKIDKSVLWEAIKSDTARIILQNTVRMIKEMNLRIVVEGVETEEQKQLVLDLNCDYIQGYIFCKPVPELQFIQYVKEFNGLED